MPLDEKAGVALYLRSRRVNKLACNVHVRERLGASMACDAESGACLEWVIKVIL